MHPQLVVSKHPHCREQIEALIRCHEANAVLKFFGVCNDAKLRLDRCFREEKALKAKESLRESKRVKERLKERLALLQQVQAGGSTGSPNHG